MALGFARLGPNMRLGNVRLGYYSAFSRVLFGATDRTGGEAVNDARTLSSSISIDEQLNHEPDTARIRVKNFVPVQGEQVRIFLGALTNDFQLFGGHVLRLESHASGSHIYYDLGLIDYTWLLANLKVTKRYVGQTATAIIQDLVANFGPGFITTSVEAGMPVIDEITFTREDLPDAISRTMERVGGYWYTDVSKDIHAFTVATESAAPITDAAKRGARNFRISVDLSQIATRVLGRGGGAVTLADASVGQTSLPIEDPAWYSVSGGTVQVGPQDLTYTAVAAGSEEGSSTGYIGTPPDTFVLSPQVPGSLANGTYRVAVTYTTAEGETTPSAYKSITLSGSDAGIFVSSIPVPTDPKITTKRVYVTDVGGVALKFFGATSVAATTMAVTTAGTTAVPTSNTAGFSREVTLAGATSLQVEDLAQFLASGWAEAPGGQVFSYTGRSGTSGSGSLTGIPPSGIGALTADVRTGTVKNVPHLTGIPSSGSGSIVYEVKKGETAYLTTMREDATAQTALAGWIGSGDGVREYVFSDGRLSLAELEARCDAILAERKDPWITVSFESRDPSIRVGRNIAISITTPPISGTFQIQRVNISEMAFDGRKMRVFPKRQVEASSKRFSFEDLVRQIRLVGRPS